MYAKILKQMSRISDNEEDNVDNYLEACGFIDELYQFLGIIKKTPLNISDIEFLPSFKGMYTCSKLGLGSRPEENNMKYFVIKSEKILGDVKLKNKLIEEIEHKEDWLANIIIDNDIITIINNC